MKKIKSLMTVLVFSAAAMAAFGFKMQPKRTAFNVDAFNASTCPATSVSVNCSTSTTQTCNIGGIDYKLKDVNGNCNRLLGLNP